MGWVIEMLRTLLTDPGAIQLALGGIVAVMLTRRYVATRSTERQGTPRSFEGARTNAKAYVLEIGPVLEMGPVPETQHHGPTDQPQTLAPSEATHAA